ncbi:MAG: hydrogenase [Candidatus Omnitrophota bacterium]|nr:hydrogenase [Candidatus Omnitrophota bacterium]
MLTIIFLSGFLLSLFLMVVAKRITALVKTFALQSLFLSLYALYVAVLQRHAELLIISGLIFILKVIIIPRVILRIKRRINVEEDLGLTLNTQVSLIVALFLMYFSYLFISRIISFSSGEAMQAVAFTVSFTAVFIGLFLMIFRQKALSQVVGLLVMENGTFLAALAITGGMPFLVEIAIFFDVFIFVLIIEILVYRINRLFTHIDTTKLTTLKG